MGYRGYFSKLKRVREQGKKFRETQFYYFIQKEVKGKKKYWGQI
jgi:hypothetical protein